MKKTKILIVFMMLAIVLSFSNYGVSSVSAKKTESSDNKAAKKAFREWLSQDSIKWPTSNDRYFDRDSYSFKYMELCGGKIPVLFVSSTETCHADGYVSMLQYVDGKIKSSVSEDWVEEIYKKTGIVSFCHSGGGLGEINTWYYKPNKNGQYGEYKSFFGYTAILQDGYEEWRDEFGEDKYELYKKSISKNKFARKMKKITKGEKPKKIGKMYKNTAKNRKKYI